MSEEVPLQLTLLSNPQPPQAPIASLPETPAHSSNNSSERLMHKNRLQEYTQRSSLRLPLYTTVNEGAPHAPKFRATVLVDGSHYTSQGDFPNRKSAEQDAARIALQNIQQKMKDFGAPIIQEDTTFCKSILNEYAVKMHLEKPSYDTVLQPGGSIPVFVSSLVFNNLSYTGDRGRNKKEAEQLAARAIILSILYSADSASATVMSEIIKSKYKLFAALNKIKNTSSVYSAAIPDVNTWEDPGVQLNKRNDSEVSNVTANLPITVICGSNSAEPAKTQAAHLPLQQQHLPVHQFKKCKTETSTGVIAPPIVFVPPALEQPLLSSTSGAKRNRRNKKKAKMGVQIGPQMPAAVVPLTQIPPCSVAQ